MNQETSTDNLKVQNAVQDNATLLETNGNRNLSSRPWSAKTLKILTKRAVSNQSKKSMKSWTISSTTPTALSPRTECLATHPPNLAPKDILKNKSARTNSRTNTPITTAKTKKQRIKGKS